MPLFEKAYNESEPGEFDDEATTSYTTSKWAQVTKIAMAFSASRGDDLIITKQDFHYLCHGGSSSQKRTESL